MIIELIILILSIPCGLLLAWLSRDELIYGRIWFKKITIFFAILSVFFYIYGKKDYGFTSLFISITVMISHIKSFDKIWIKKV